MIRVDFVHPRPRFSSVSYGHCRCFISLNFPVCLDHFLSFIIQYLPPCVKEILNLKLALITSDAVNSILIPLCRFETSHYTRFILSQGYPKPFSLWGLKGLTECPSIVYPLDDEIHFVRKSQVWKYTGFGSGDKAVKESPYPHFRLRFDSDGRKICSMIWIFGVS